jgi:hypothetical protein
MVIGAAVGAGVSAKQAKAANAVIKTQARRERSIVDEYLVRNLVGVEDYRTAPWHGR